MVFIDESIYVIHPSGYDMTSCCLRTGRVLLLTLFILRVSATQSTKSFPGGNRGNLPGK